MGADTGVATGVVKLHTVCSVKRVQEVLTACAFLLNDFSGSSQNSVYSRTLKSTTSCYEIVTPFSVF